MYESYGCCIWGGYICALGLPYRGSPQPIAEGPIIAPGFVIPPCQAAKLAPYPYSADISHGDCTCPIWTGWSKGLDALSHWFIGLVSGHPPTLSGETAPESNWFWISGCLPGTSAPWLGDASSTSASRFLLLTGAPPPPQYVFCADKSHLPYLVHVQGSPHRVNHHFCSIHHTKRV